MVLDMSRFGLLEAVRAPCGRDPSRVGRYREINDYKALGAEEQAP
jgi:hypothetical protein